MNEPIKDWYLRRFPLDDAGRHLKQSVTFGDIMHLLNDFDGYYNKLNDLINAPANDSLVRARVASKALQLKYDNRRLTDLATAMRLTDIAFERLELGENATLANETGRKKWLSAYKCCRRQPSFLAEFLEEKIKKATELFDLEFFYSKKLKVWVLILKDALGAWEPERVACEVKDKEFWANHYREIAY